jgi:hypothetical protein
VFTPVQHLGFTAGLDVDVPLSGGISTETDSGGTSTTTSFSASMLNVGVSLGMLGYF